MRRPSRIAAGICLLAATVLPGWSPADGTPSFTKIANDGAPATANATLGPAPRDWACTRDERTGLTWEVKTADGGLRDRRWTYTPYDSNPETNGGWEGYKDATSGECLREAMDERSCNTEAYVAAVNRERVCGYSDWRLPTVAELTAVAAETARETPDTTQRRLPNTADGWYWTGVERVGVTAFSRVVLLPTAGRPHFYDGSYLVLAVREGSEAAATQSQR